MSLRVGCDQSDLFTAGKMNMLSFRPPVLRSCHRWTAREGLARNKRSVSRHVLRYLANVGAVDMSLFPSSLGEMERKKNFWKVLTKERAGLFAIPSVLRVHVYMCVEDVHMA